jgi:thrombospondin type 3 repeat protein
VRWLGTACLLAGCNQLWGLEQTELIDGANIMDTDGDGILDQIDDCVGLANPDQVDTDGDGLGDACDPCPTGSNHDEDKDGILDGCDNCPQLVNVDQANDDGDDLGNVCDHDPGIQTRVLFDGFESLSDAWVHVFIDWEAKDDAVSPTADTLSTAGLWNLRHRVEGKSWYIEIGFTVPNVDGDYGINGFAPTTGDPEFPCRLHRSGGNWSIMAKSAQIAITPAPQGVLTLRLRRDATSSHCELAGYGDASTIDNNSLGTQPGIESTGINHQFFYLDAVSGP